MMQMLPFEYSLELCPVLLVCGPLLTRYAVLHLSHYELPIILQTMHPPASNINDTVLHLSHYLLSCKQCTRPPAI